MVRAYGQKTVSTYTAMKSGLKGELDEELVAEYIVSTYTAMKSGLKAKSTTAFTEYPSTEVSTYTAMKSGLKVQFGGVGRISVSAVSTYTAMKSGLKELAPRQRNNDVQSQPIPR